MTMRARPARAEPPVPPDPLAGLPVLFSLDQGSAVLGFSSAKGYRLALAGQFPGAVRLGTRWYVRREGLRRWLEGTSAEPAEPAAVAELPPPDAGGRRPLRAV